MRPGRWRVRCFVCDPSRQSILLLEIDQATAARELSAHLRDHHWPDYEGLVVDGRPFGVELGVAEAC